MHLIKRRDNWTFLPASTKPRGKENDNKRRRTTKESLGKVKIRKTQATRE
jgi:hypothetical protein